MSRSDVEVLLTGAKEPEDLVRAALAILEADLREAALVALADWERVVADRPRLATATPDTFHAVAALQRPSYGSWNGLLAALRNARKAVLRSGAADDRARLEAAATLNGVLEALDGQVSGAPFQRLGEVARARVGKNVRWSELLALPIALRNRVAHDPPASEAAWTQLRDALAPLLEVAPLETVLAAAPHPTPWFDVVEGERGAWNGLDREFAVLYVARRATRHASERAHEALLACRRLLGRVDAEERDFRRLLGKLAPEELRGFILGDFHVGRPIGEGGHATVHVGRQLSTGRKVALKVLRDGLPEEVRSRFQQEAAFLSRFAHPNVVSVLGYGEEVWSLPRGFSLGDEPWVAAFSKTAPVKAFIALEWIEGRTLDSVLAGDDAPRAELAEWFAQAGEALGAVHAAGLVHRDVKPANVMVADDGRVKLMDFGVARSRSEVRTIVTETGRALGTPAYMSPEQLRARDGEEVGPASDVYSLAATFYEVFTRARLYRHDVRPIEDVNQDKLRGVPPIRPRSIARGLPWELETILLAGLDAEPSARYPNGEELARDVRRFLADEPILKRRPALSRRLRLAYRRNRKVANLIAVFLGVLLVATTQYVRAREGERRQLARANVLLGGVLREKGERALEAREFLSAEAYFAGSLELDDVPDGRAGVQRARAGGVQLLGAWRGPEWTRVLWTDGTRAIFELQDGSAVAGPLGGALVTLPHRVRAVSGDGARWFVARGDTLEVVDAASGRGLERIVVAGERELKTVAAVGSRGVIAAGLTTLVSRLDEGAPPRYMTLADPPPTLLGARPNGEVVSATGGTILCRAPGGPRIELGTSGQSVEAAAIDATGRRLATAGSEGKVRIWDLVGRTELAVLHVHDSRLEKVSEGIALRPPRFTGLALTEGGGKLLATLSDGRVFFWEAGEGAASRCRGRWTLLSANGEVAFYLFASSGELVRRTTGEVLITIPEAELSETVAVSEDARLLSWVNQRGDLLVVEVATGEGHRRPGCAFVRPAFSGDGRRLAYATDRRIHIADVSSIVSTEVASIEVAQSIAWMTLDRSGETLVYGHGRDRVGIHRLASGRATAITVDDVRPPAALSHDASLLVLGEDEPRVIDVGSGRVLRRLPKGKHAFAAESKVIATATYDGWRGTVAFRTASGESIGAFEADVETIALAADGKTLFTTERVRREEVVVVRDVGAMFLAKEVLAGEAARRTGLRLDGVSLTLESPRARWPE